MKVLFVVTWFHNYKEPPSAGVFHYEQAVCLSKNCEVAIYYPFDQVLKAPYNKEIERGITTYRSRWTGNAVKRRETLAAGFAKVIKDFRPDIINAHVASQAGVYSIIAGTVYNIPVITTEHNPVELMGLESKTTYARNRLVYHKSKANICVSVDQKNRLSALFPKDSFGMIYNGVMDPWEKNDVIKYRKEPGINAAIIASFYSKEIKGYQFLLPAIQKLIEEGLEITLHIVGGGIYEDYYRQMAADLGIEDHCIFYGACDHSKVYSIAGEMDYIISASIFEASGVSVQEAMLLGKPLVVTKSGGANSLVTEKTAIVVDRNSIDALADGIKRMSESFRSFDTNEIRRYALDNFEIESVNKKYLKLYSEILGKEEKSN